MVTVSRRLPSEFRGEVLAERMVRVGDSGPSTVGMLDLERVIVYVWEIRSAKMKP